jgi:hypothetical protein
MTKVIVTTIIIMEILIFSDIIWRGLMDNKKGKAYSIASQEGPEGE